MQAKDSTFIDDMTKMIIRPRRDLYPIDKLGPTQLIVKSRNAPGPREKNANQYMEVQRKDTKIDCKGQKVQLSYFHFLEREQKKEEHSSFFRQGNQLQRKDKKCVVYLHANSGSRIEGLELVKFVLPFGWSLALFDYRGSGLSDGQYTSMGVCQSDDLQSVLSYLSENEGISQFSLWGRSMGAVTILYYLIKHYYNHLRRTGIFVRAVVLDSPFSNMQKLMFQIGSSTVHLPEFVFLPFVSSISAKLVEKIGVNLITELNLIQRINQLKESKRQVVGEIQKICGLFLTSTEDKLVHCSHVELLHKEFPFQNKELHYYNGQHNDSRSDVVKNKCAAFLCQGIGEVGKIKKQSNQVGQPEIGSPLLKRIGKNQIEDNRKRELQFLLPPTIKKPPELNSPKFQKAKPQVGPFSLKFQPKQQAKCNKFQAQLARPPQLHHYHRVEPRPESSLPPQPTIIINHNCNVSVNLYDAKRSMQLVHESIPPINFNQTGHLTDRFREMPNHNKYYIPCPAKVQKRHGELGSSWSNMSNASSESHQSNSFTCQQINPMMGFEYSRTNKGRASHDLGHQTCIITQQIDIPLLRFEGLDFDSHREDEINMNNSVIDNSGLKKSAKPFKMGVNSPTGVQRQKLSLAELRKFQKQQNERCVMKSAKMIDISDDFEKINVKKQAHVDDSWNYKSSQGEREKFRSMKTSLMVRRKPGERKQGEYASGIINGNAKEKSQQKTAGLFLMGRPTIHSPKNQYK